MFRRIDPRLLIGLVLVLGSVAGVVALVMALDRRTDVYVTTATLVPGQLLDGSALVERAVQLDGAEELYLRVGQLPVDGLVVTRAMRPGELIPIAALGAAAGTDLTSIVVTPAAELSAGIEPASAVELWVTVPAQGGELDAPPRVLVPDAVVVSVDHDTGIDSFGGTATIELLVPRGRLPMILQAQADDAVLSVVPTGIAWRAP